MQILLVDDDTDSLVLLEQILRQAGYDQIRTAMSVHEALQVLHSPESSGMVGVILMDVMLPQVTGIEGCRYIKEQEHLRDIPVIMVTARTGENDLEQAFAAGANDYITKPFRKVELLARLRPALGLKQERDWRKARERELLEVSTQLQIANHTLQMLSCQDGLTGIANRRHFEETLRKDWRQAMRDQTPLSLILVDVDHFKAFNDYYGHQAGDACLKRVAQTLSLSLSRPGDVVARYGGEEFAVLLADTDLAGAVKVARTLCENVQDLGIPHEQSATAPMVTISLGVAAANPTQETGAEMLLRAADDALYRAKALGRNRLESQPPQLDLAVCTASG